MKPITTVHHEIWMKYNVLKVKYDIFLFSCNLVIFLKLITQGGMHMHQYSFYNALKEMFDQSGAGKESMRHIWQT